MTLKRDQEDELDSGLEMFADRVLCDVKVDEQSRVAGLFEVSFTQDSADLWLMLLATMNAAYSSGYEAIGITARPSEPPPAIP